MVTPAALQRFQSRSITSMLGSAAGTTWATTFLFTKSSGHLVLACSRGILMPRKSSNVLSRSLHRPQVAPNNSFKPNALRSTNQMADKAYNCVDPPTQLGLTQALDGQ